MQYIHYNETKQQFHLQNQAISYVFGVEEKAILSHLYFGKRIDSYQGGRRYPRLERSFSTNFQNVIDRNYSRDTIPHEYPTYGNGDFRSAAIAAKLADGDPTLDLRYVGFSMEKGKPALMGLPATYVSEESEAETLFIELADEKAQVTVRLAYTIFADYPVIARSATITNNSADAVQLEKAASLSIDLPYQEWDLLHLNGSWGQERSIVREPVTKGIKIFDSKRGTSSHQQNPFVALADPNCTEDKGAAIGFSLIYSGNHEELIEMDQYGQIRVGLGINPSGFSWELQPEDTFQTPEALMVYSEEGLNGMSQTFHTLFRENLSRGQHRKKERPILINNWEATYFDFTGEKIRAIIDESAELGIELFVLDDGWFGTRSNDRRSLGDWTENREKLPEGLKGIADYAHGKGMQFGLWFEPEMISEVSELFTTHPDWALQIPGRERTLSRDQLVLDFSRKEVRDGIIGQMRAILEQVPIDYIKWDMNRYLTEVHSSALPPHRQGETAHRYVLGLYAMMEELVQAYPEILFEGCSGGGGRFDPGILYYMPQSWTSDNTDAVQRLQIQYGTSLVYPISAMGAHVSAVPNHQTHRITSLAMRGDVAMAGVLGYELDPTTLTEEEKQIIRRQVTDYKQYRRLVQYGSFHRLRSPFEKNQTIWAFVSEDQSECLLYYYSVLAQAAPPLDIIKLRGLDPERVYHCDELDATFSATELMHSGFYVDPIIKGDFQSRRYYFKAK